MADKSKRDYFAPVAVALLLILTAWGNAIAMFVVAAATLMISLTVFRGRLGLGGPLAALVAAVVAIVVAAVFVLR
jgi:hypothetical protein